MLVQVQALGSTADRSRWRSGDALRVPVFPVTVIYVAGL